MSDKTQRVQRLEPLRGALSRSAAHMVGVVEGLLRGRRGTSAARARYIGHELELDRPYLVESLASDVGC
jgi:hypothetical protein